MRIGILGSGNMGGALGRLFSAAGHEVTYSYSRKRSKLEALARASGPSASVGSPADAVRDADLVLLAVHWGQVPNVLRQAGSLDGVVLVDCTNPMTDDDSALAIGHTTSGAEEIARMLPRARVVKAFNTVPAELLTAIGKRSLARRRKRPAVCFCGDDDSAKERVASLIKEIGLEPVDSGPLRIARYLEPMALLVAELAYEQDLGPELGISFLRYTEAK